MTETQAIQLFKCLADKSRMQILKSLMIEDMYVERLAQRLNLTPATISFHLKKLEDVGAVSSTKDQYYMMYSLRREVFQTNIWNLIQEESDDAQKQEERDESYRNKVIQTFFEYGKLKSIPAQRKKEKIILEEIAKAFEQGKVYKEKEVNLIIADFHDDFCTIRRDMSGGGMFVRQDGNYVRQ